MAKANSRARALLGVENCANGSRTPGPDQESEVFLAKRYGATGQAALTYRGRLSRKVVQRSRGYLLR